MSAPKSLCACRMPAAECCCDPDDLATAPVAKPKPERRTCQYCKRKVVQGKHGWRVDLTSAAGYTCADAPLGYHGVGKPAELPAPGKA